jgi:hypothetical protein
LGAKIVIDLRERDRYGHSALLGKTKREWQVGYFGKEAMPAGRVVYWSPGGWKVRRKGQDRIKSDQSILEEGDFVDEAWSHSEKQGSRNYGLKGRGYDFEKVAERVSAVLQLEKHYITGKGRRRDRGDLLCYWSAAESGRSTVDIAGRLELTPAAIRRAVQRGEKTVKEEGYKMEERDSSQLTVVPSHVPSPFLQTKASSIGIPLRKDMPRNRLEESVIMNYTLVLLEELTYSDFREQIGCPP